MANSSNCVTLYGVRFLVMVLRPHCRKSIRGGPYLSDATLTCPLMAHGQCAFLVVFFAFCRYTQSCLPSSASSLVSVPRERERRGWGEGESGHALMGTRWRLQEARPPRRSRLPVGSWLRRGDCSHRGSTWNRPRKQAHGNHPAAGRIAITETREGKHGPAHLHLHRVAPRPLNRQLEPRGPDRAANMRATCGCCARCMRARGARRPALRPRRGGSRTRTFVDGDPHLDRVWRLGPRVLLRLAAELLR